MTVYEIITSANLMGASDIHYGQDEPISVRIDGSIQRLPANYVLNDLKSELLDLLTPEQAKEFRSGNDIDLAIQTPDGIRCRVNMFHRMGRLGCVMRILANKIPTVEELELPALLEELVMLPRGLVLVTGPTGSGKSTTLAAMLGYANRRRNSHIITIEDPVEYVHEPKHCVISQRELGRDTSSFSSALRSALREDPDIILVGEMRDYETISAAITAAETGHLVLSTVHTTGAAKSIDRIIDVFEPHQQTLVRSQLAGTLKAVITQQLVRRKEGGRVAALEIMLATPSIASLIREGKIHQINASIQTGGRDGMVLLDKSLGELVKNGTIEFEEALSCCVNEGDLRMFAKRTI